MFEAKAKALQYFLPRSAGRLWLLAFFLYSGSQRADRFFCILPTNKSAQTIVMAARGRLYEHGLLMFQKF